MRWRIVVEFIQGEGVDLRGMTDYQKSEIQRDFRSGSGTLVISEGGSKIEIAMRHAIRMSVIEEGP